MSSSDLVLLFPIGLVVAYILAYISVKKGWKITKFF